MREADIVIRKITVGLQQVKNEAPSQQARTCSGVQVLANSQRWFKIERRACTRFVMLCGRCTAVRERCGCLSVWVKFY